MPLHLNSYARVLTCDVSSSSTQTSLTIILSFNHANCTQHQQQNHLNRLHDPFTFNDQRQLIEVEKEDFVHSGEKFFFWGLVLDLRSDFYHTYKHDEVKKSGRRCNRIWKREHMLPLSVCFSDRCVDMKNRLLYLKLLRTLRFVMNQKDKPV